MLAREEGAPASPQEASPLCPRSLGHALPGSALSASLRAPSGQPVSDHLIHLFFRSSWRREALPPRPPCCPPGSLARLLSWHPELLPPLPCTHCPLPGVRPSPRAGRRLPSCRIQVVHVFSKSPMTPAQTRPLLLLHPILPCHTVACVVTCVFPQRSGPARHQASRTWALSW